MAWNAVWPRLLVPMKRTQREAQTLLSFLPQLMSERFAGLPRPGGRCTVVSEHGALGGSFPGGLSFPESSAHLPLSVALERPTESLGAEAHDSSARAGGPPWTPGRTRQA